MNEEKRMDKNVVKISLSIVIVVICLVTIWNMSHSIKDMQQESSVLRQEVGNLDVSIRSEIGGISANIDSSLKKDNSIIADYSYQVIVDKISREDKMIPLSLMVRPKEHKEGLKATFIMETEDGKIISAPGAEGEAFSYTAEMNVPLDNNMKLSVSLDDGTLQKSEKLEEIYQPFEGYFMKINSFYSEMTMNSNNKDKLGFSGTIETTFSTNIDGSNYPVSGEVQIVKNGNIFKKLPIQIDKESGFETQDANGTPDPAIAEYMAGSSGSYFTRFDEEIRYKDNDRIEFIVIIKDNYGYQHKQTIHSIRTDAQGNTYPTSVSNEVIVE